MFRAGYGLLHLTPPVLYRLTPGEVLDMLSSRAWAANELRRANRRQSGAPMDPSDVAEQVARLDRIIAKRQGGAL